MVAPGQRIRRRNLGNILKCHRGRQRHDLGERGTQRHRREANRVHHGCGTGRCRHSTGQRISYTFGTTQVQSPAAGTSGSIAVTTSCPIVATSSERWITQLSFRRPSITSLKQTQAPLLELGRLPSEIRRFRLHSPEPLQPDRGGDALFSEHYYRASTLGDGRGQRR